MDLCLRRPLRDRLSSCIHPPLPGRNSLLEAESRDHERDVWSLSDTDLLDVMVGILAVAVLMKWIS